MESYFSFVSCEDCLTILNRMKGLYRAFEFTLIRNHLKKVCNHEMGYVVVDL